MAAEHPNTADTGAGWRLDKIVLAAIFALTIALLTATPQLIVPYPAKAPWYESAAMFPRVALGIAIVGALAEWIVRRGAFKAVASEELDSSEASPLRAAGAVALFAGYAFAVPLLGFMVSTAVFLLVCGRWVGLSWQRAALIALPMAVLMWGVFVVALKVAFGHGWLI